MKKTILVLSILWGLTATAQTIDAARRTESRSPKIEWTIAELQETLEISEAEAQKVRSIMDSHEAKTAEMRTAKKKQMQGLRRTASELTDTEIEKLQLQRFEDMRQKIDQEEQNYKAMRQVLSPSQIQKLEQAERKERKSHMHSKGVPNEQ